LIISFQLGCDDVLAGLVEEVFSGFFAFVEALAEDDVAAVDMVDRRYGYGAKLKGWNWKRRCSNMPGP
jgi:hypothetical protein